MRKYGRREKSRKARHFSPSKKGKGKGSFKGNSVRNYSQKEFKCFLCLPFSFYYEPDVCFFSAAGGRGRLTFISHSFPEHTDTHIFPFIGQAGIRSLRSLPKTNFGKLISPQRTSRRIYSIRILGQIAFREKPRSHWTLLIIKRTELNLQHSASTVHGRYSRT